MSADSVLCERLGKLYRVTTRVREAALILFSDLDRVGGAEADKFASRDEVEAMCIDLAYVNASLEALFERLCAETDELRGTK